MVYSSNTKINKSQYIEGNLHRPIQFECNLEMLVFVEGRKHDNQVKNTQTMARTNKKVIPTYGTRPELNQGQIGETRDSALMTAPCLESRRIYRKLQTRKCGLDIHKSLLNMMLIFLVIIRIDRHILCLRKAPKYQF